MCFRYFLAELGAASEDVKAFKFCNTRDFLKFLMEKAVTAGKMPKAVTAEAGAELGGARQAGAECVGKRGMHGAFSIKNFKK